MAGRGSMRGITKGGHPERVTAHAAELAARFMSVAPCRHVGVDVLVDGRVDEGGVTMSIAESSASVEVSELTPEEATAVFDRIVRSALNLSGEQFLADFDAGKFDDVEPDAHPGLLDVLMALPLVR